MFNFLVTGSIWVRLVINILVEVMILLVSLCQIQLHIKVYEQAYHYYLDTISLIIACT